MTDEARFAQTAGHVRTIAEPMLREWFGERCADFEPDCHVCQRWAALDALTKNPFSEEKVTT